MTLLPIVGRELRVASRKWGTYWSRLSLPLMLMIFFFITLISDTRSRPAEMGRNLFLMATWICFVFCAIGGMRVAGDCISSEKREGTLGLLFLTDLKGYDVILGKLLAASTNTISALVGVLPVLCIPLLLGGVSLLTFLKVAITLATVLLLSLSLAILFSTLGKHERTGGGLTFLAMLVLCGVTGIAYAILNDVYGDESPWWVDYLRLCNPGFTCYFASIETPLKSTATWDWFQSWACQLVTITGALTMASWLVPRVWQEKTTAPRLWWRRWLNWLYYGPSDYRAKVRRHWLEINPVAWLAVRNRLKHQGAWAFLAILFGGWLLLRFKIGREVYNIELTNAIMFTLFIGIKLALVSEAGLVFSRDIRSGAMELVLTTPMTITEILRGQVLALIKQFYRPAIAIMVLNSLLLSLTYYHHGVPHNDQVITFMTFLAGIIVFMADLYALAWAGMWAGISAKNANAAIGEAMSKVLFIPWFILYFTMAALGVLSFLLKFDWEPAFSFFLGLWFVGSLVNDVFWLRYSRNHLQSEFRRMALQRYDPARRHQFWRSLGRTLGHWVGK